jgi:hypothetical protein
MGSRLAAHSELIQITRIHLSSRRVLNEQEPLNYPHKYHVSYHCCLLEYDTIRSYSIHMDSSRMSRHHHSHYVVHHHIRKNLLYILRLQDNLRHHKDQRTHHSCKLSPHNILHHRKDQHRCHLDKSCPLDIHNQNNNHRNHQHRWK